MDGSMDLSQVVSLIMKHPELIETIANLAKSEALAPSTEEAEAVAAPVAEHTESPDSPTRETVRGLPSEAVPLPSKRENRKRLFSAIRPFLSEERAKTLSGVEAVVSILDSLHG